MKAKTISPWFIHGYKVSRKNLDRDSKVHYTVNPQFVLVSSLTPNCNIMNDKPQWSKRDCTVAVPFTILEQPWKQLFRHVAKNEILQKILDYCTLEICEYYKANTYERVEPEFIHLQKSESKEVDILLKKFGIVGAYKKHTLEAVANVISVGMDIRKQNMLTTGMINEKYGIDNLFIHLICEDIKSRSQVMISEMDVLHEKIGRYTIVQHVFSNPERIILTVLLHKLNEIGLKEEYFSLLEKTIERYMYTNNLLGRIIPMNITTKDILKILQESKEWPTFSAVFTDRDKEFTVHVIYNFIELTKKIFVKMPPTFPS